jgi:Ca2+-transporting ATPase
MSILITVVQETRTERVLETLRDLTSPRALVIRDGTTKRIAGREVVSGDLILLAEGDRVPADALLAEAHDLLTDESLLTGESIPVRKVAAAHSDAAAVVRRPGGDDLPMVFSGSLVVRGSGVGEVTQTGPRSEIGKIGQALSSLETESPRLQQQTQRVVRLFAIVGGAVSLLAVLLYGVVRGGWLDAVLAGIALGMSMLPEEFPVVLTVFMAMGAWRISRARVLTRRAAAIETLGSTTVLCTDKTGTLTENRMSVVELYAGDDVLRANGVAGPPVPEIFSDLIRFGVLASARQPVDPMEKAIHEINAQLTGSASAQIADGKLARVYGLRPGLLAMTQAWGMSGDHAGGFVLAAKGAPEAIVDLCHLDPVQVASLKVRLDDMAARGLRVLGVARARYSGGKLPESQHDFDFAFLGLIGLADPLRASVPDAVGQCRRAGIKVLMITGDYPATARAIARDAGLGDEGLLTGDQLNRLSDAELAARVRTTSVFARIMPEQKLRIVSALKTDGEIVGMTGDGVNDAASLKAAHIGIAMGGRGTDVTREASSIVLLDDDFGSIVKTIRLGRRIYDNLRKAMGFTFAVHVPIAGLALLPIILDLPILLGPIHIAFLEMVINPVCSLVFEAESDEDDIMRRTPRPPDEPLFSSRLIGWGVSQGVVAFGLVAVIFLAVVYRGMPENEVRALTFFSLVLVIVSLIFVNRSFDSSLISALRTPNSALAWVLLGVTGVLALSLLWPVARELFRFGPLHPDDLLLVLGAGLVAMILMETIKPVWRPPARPS